MDNVVIIVESANKSFPLIPGTSFKSTAPCFPHAARCIGTDIRISLRYLIRTIFQFLLLCYFSVCGL